MEKVEGPDVSFPQRRQQYHHFIPYYFITLCQQRKGAEKGEKGRCGCISQIFYIYPVPAFIICDTGENKTAEPCTAPPRSE
jgi:hypothetical protein